MMVVGRYARCVGGDGLLCGVGVVWQEPGESDC